MVSTGWRELGGTDRPGMRHAGAVADRGGSIGDGVSLPYVRENKCLPGKRVHETPGPKRPKPPLNARSPPLQPLALWPFLPGRGPRPPQSSSMDKIAPLGDCHSPSSGLYFSRSLPCSST